MVNKRTKDYVKDLYVKNIFHYDLHSIDANQQIFDSLKAFERPFKISVLVYENNKVVGTLNLSDVIASLNASSCTKLCYNTHSRPVRCIMSRVFVPIDYNSALSEIFVDVLNCESLIHPVYYRNHLKGVLHKETILDIIKLQMLFDAI